MRQEVVAEGADTSAQQAFLQALGCDEIQGYLFAKLMSAEQIENHCAVVRKAQKA